ncbi:MAG TPA: hypothetical protein VLM40_05290 [Gemmata sp.]|nr:hypothetical protein [Gemmata sp.]
MMVFGDSYFGLVDRVPGLFYVKTRFLHVWWVPLVPRESWVIHDDGRGKHGYRIPLSWKSVFVAWSRLALGVMFTMVALMLVPIFEADPRKMTIPPVVAAGVVVALLAVLVGAYVLTYRWARPREKRAFQLAMWLRIDPAEMADRFPVSQSTESPGETA